MLSYPIEDAEELLTSKLSAAKQSHSNCEEDLDFLREQITVRAPFTSCDSMLWMAVPPPLQTQGRGQLANTRILAQTMEVAIARVYNWDVVQKRKEKADAESKGEKEGSDQPNG